MRLKSSHLQTFEPFIFLTKKKRSNLSWILPYGLLTLDGFLTLNGFLTLDTDLSSVWRLFKSGYQI
jgi:hypothetical protein